MQCNCTESFLWKPAGENQHLCNDCFEKNSKNVKIELDTMTTVTTFATTAYQRPDERKTRLRKSTRSTRYSGKNGNGSASNATTNNGSGAASAVTTKVSGVKSGRGRRSLFRRPPMKAPTISATTTSVKSLFYKVHTLDIILKPILIVSILNSNSDFRFYLYAGLVHTNWRHCFVV